MELGTFSVSLTVKDIQVSYEFYQKLGFTIFGGDISQNWVILKNDRTVIGLFQGMFDKNIMTFNPGWDNNAKNLQEFTDVRKIQKEITSSGITIVQGVSEETSGPGSIIIEDPDGNPILIDQHR